MLSSQSPTIVARDDHCVLSPAPPAAAPIPNTVLCVLVNVLDFDMDARTAVDAPRMHHQWLPDRVLLEAGSEPNMPRWSDN